MSKFDNIPKKKYRDKVRERLQKVHETLLSDPDRLIEMMKRVGGFDKGSDLHNKIEAIQRLLEIDIPTLLDAFDKLSSEKPDDN